MYKITLFIFLLIAGCHSREDISRIAVQQTTIDSLKTVVNTGIYISDSLKLELRRQKILINFTAQKCHKYAAIVKKNPTQSVFIVNWIDRSFKWIDEL